MNRTRIDMNSKEIEIVFKYFNKSTETEIVIRIEMNMDLISLPLDRSQYKLELTLVD